MSTKPQILVIDDEQQILRALRTILFQHDYQVTASGSGLEGLALASTLLPDLIVLDLGLPDISGVEVCLRLRVWTDIPIIILSAHDNEAEKVAALDAGADDYLTKPFGVEELLARVRVALRHHVKSQPNKSPIISVGSLTIDLANHLVKHGNDLVKLTATEYKLLAYLAGNAGRVLTHKLILNHVWGYSDGSQMVYLRVYVRQLRQKIEENPRNPQIIVTKSGIGYRFIA